MDNYSGNPDAVQAPSPAAGPNAVMVVEIPSDTTDDINAASIAQGFKVTADGITMHNAAMGGTRSYKSLVVDGTGGAAATGVAGRITASENIEVGGDANVTGQVVTTSGNIRSGGDVYGGGFFPSVNAAGSAVPTPSNFSGYLSRELIPFAWIIYTPTGGALIQGTNIASATYNSVGHYTFVTQRPATQGLSNNICVLATASGTGMIATATAMNSGGATSIGVTVTDATGAAADPNTVNVLVFSG